MKNFWRTLHAAGALCLTAGAAWCGGAEIEPLEKVKDWAEGSAVLERWARVQGLDRPAAEVYPRDLSLAITENDAEKGVLLRLLDDGRDKYRLNIVRPDDTSYTEICPDRNTRWLVSETVGIGQLPAQTNPMLRLLHGLRVDLTMLWRTHRAWSRGPDVTRDGKTYQRVALKRVDGGWDIWSFDADTGVRTMVESLSEKNELLSRMRFGDFHDVDGALEPFELVDESASSHTTIRTKALRNKVPVSRTSFELSPEHFNVWLSTEEVLKKYVASCGGEAALAQIVSRVTESSGENQTMGTKFEIVFSQKAPRSFVMETSVARVGREWEGFDGATDTGWRYSEIKGFRALRGRELELFSRSGLLNLERFNQTYPLRRPRGVREIDGRKVAVMDLANLEGSAGTHYFDWKTGQLLRVEAVLGANAENQIPVTVNFSDFRTVDGITLPFTTEIINPALRIVTNVKSVRHNVEIDDAIFRPRKDE